MSKKAGGVFLCTDRMSFFSKNGTFGTPFVVLYADFALQRTIKLNK